MPMSCAVYGCKNRYTKDCSLQFFGFPLKDASLLTLWLQAIRREDFRPTKWSKLCSAHFNNTDYLVRPRTSRPKLKPDAVPSVLPKKEQETKNFGIVEVKGVLMNVAQENIPMHEQETQNLDNPEVRGVLMDVSQENIPVNEQETQNFDNPEGKSVLMDVSQENIPMNANIDDMREAVSHTTDKGIQTIETMQSLSKLKQQVKTLQQKVRRKNDTITNMKTLLEKIRRGTSGYTASN